MKKNYIYSFLVMLILAFDVTAEDVQYSQDHFDKACSYLGEYCDITKQKCASEKALNQDKCFIDYVGRVVMTQETPRDPADMRNVKLANEACTKLGDECKFIKLECLSSGGNIPNSCVAGSYFRIEVAKERCGIMGYKTCIEREREFSIKVIHELTLPNMNKPIKQKMWQECSLAGNYKVKSEKLKNFYYAYMEAYEHMKEPIILSKEEDYEYKIEEEYYHCMKDVLEKAS